jgi:methionyl aminopeptidase
MEIDQELASYAKMGAMIPTHDMIKSESQIEGMRKAGKANTMVLDYIEAYVKEGISTEELNTLVDDYTRKIGGIPATLGYEGYPKSVCTSINEVVCHGIPDPNRILKSGDIINVDATTIIDSFYGDASRMYYIGDVLPEHKRLVEVAKECLELGLAQVKPWSFLGNVGYVINKHAKKNGYSVVREIGGHGLGTEFHEEPWVSHIGQMNTDYILVPGMIFTIEPMINLGKAAVVEDAKDGWTIRTADNKPSAQWEYTILVTDTGAEILSY